MNLLWIDKEKHIVNLFRKGDPLAMNKLYMEYADYLTGVCARYISDEETLKDVLQESFIKIYTQIQRFEYRGKGSLKAWITRIAINEALGELQKDKHLFVPIQEPHIKDFPDEEPDTDGVDTDTLLSFIRQLPPGYRAVFNLFVVEEKSHKEIAEMLHIQPGTSASQFARARNMLAEMIQKYKHQTEDRGKSNGTKTYMTV